MPEHGNSLDIECPVCHAPVGILCTGARSTEHVARTRAYWATQPVAIREQVK
jgi:hypothetical protein